MPLNVIKESVEEYLEAAAADRNGDEHTCAFLKCALTKPLVRALANQDTPEDLQPVRRVRSKDPGWLRLAFNEGKTLYRFDPAPRLQDDICRVIDWIMISQRYDAGWLDDCDEQGRPKKLLKIGSLEQALTEVDKGMEILSRHDAANSFRDLPGEKTVMTFNDNYRIVSLLTAKALDREGDLMGHCLGNGEYDADLGSGDCRFYSLRDSGNRAHATMQVRNCDNALWWAQGKQSMPPVSQYIPYIQAIIKRENMEPKWAPLNHSCLLKQGDEYFDVLDLPDGFHHEGFLDLAGIPVEKLPDNMRVDGDLCLSGTGITTLPENLVVGGRLFLDGTAIETLPHSLQAAGKISLRHSKISKLPENFRTHGGLDISGSNIAGLPPGLHIGGDLSMEDTAINEFPDDLIVEDKIFCPGLTMLLNGTRQPIKLDELREQVASKERPGAQGSSGATFKPTGPDF